MRPEPLCLLGMIGILLSCAVVPYASAQSCSSQGVVVQVLGSGGPELQDKRASSSYLVWENGQPRVLIDAGGGSALRFGESGATMSQLDVILFSHFHVDHSGDFSALIKSSWFEDRSPRRSRTAGKRPFWFLSDLFGDHGAYRYLSELLVAGEGGSYRMEPHNVVAGATPVMAFRSSDLSASAARVIHGGVPALAWRVEVGGKSVVFSGDTNGEGNGLAHLAKNADLFVAHNAVAEGATGVERKLHMPPSRIGQIAADANVKSLVLSHRMMRTLGKEDQTQAEIRKHYSGPLAFANDLDCFAVK